MKPFFFSIPLCILLSACNNTATQPAMVQENSETTISNDFFPVTNFIKGQLVDIRNSGINPLKITTAGKRPDSVWLRVEELESAFEDFLSPTIDSAALWPFFKENKFLDQTLNTYTFTYEPLSTLPDSLRIRRWDVHINPKTHSVKRIYIEKLDSKNNRLQLTWQTSEWCKIVTLSADNSGNQALAKEVIIKWKFE